jgi:hypothetical protein
MIATLLGSALGVTIAIGISVASVGELLLSSGTPVSIGIQILVGNIFLAVKSEFWVFGSVVLLSALTDFVYYKISRENLKVSLSMLDMAIGILQKFGYHYSLGVLSVIAGQTCMLLWWGVVLSNVLAHLPASAAIALVPFLGFSLYWTVEVFHAIMATLSSGCVLWYFLRDDNSPLAPSDRVALYLRVALTSSLGSVCKGALFSPPSQMYCVKI